MSDNEFQRSLVSLLIVIGIGVVLFVTGINIGTEAGYKEGQTDALNGKWKYELKTDTVAVTTVLEKEQ
jgi:hypothetical protein